MAFELFSNVLVYLKDEIDTLLAGKSAVGHGHTHASTTGQTADDHHPQSHTLTSHSTRAHSDLTGIGADDHHAQAHTLASHSAKAHGDLSNIGADDHHAQVHAHSSHSGIGADDHHAQGHTLASHSTKAHSELSSIGTDDHHAKGHAHNAADGTAKLTQGNSHESADTDSAGLSLHHTLGAGATQAAAGNHSHSHSHAIPVLGNLDNTVAASTTRYVSIQAGGALDSSEANARVYFSMAGTLKNWRLRTTTAQSANNSFVLTVYKNGIAGALAITIAAGAAAGAFSDLTNTIAVGAGDEVSLEFKNNANATSARISGWGFEFDPA